MTVASVLVAEDDSALRAALCDLIDSDPRFFLASQARDAAEAVEEAVRVQPDLALLDIKMPNGGGIRAAKQIRVGSPRTQIIALSAYSDGDTVFQMMAAGAIGYLVKGSSADEIIAALSRAIEGAATSSAEVAAEVVCGIAQRDAEERRLAEARNQLRRRIQRVLTGDNYHLVFQPIVELSSLRMVGVEALSRFTMEPQRGPLEWFADAQTCGLRTALELLAVTEALGAMNRHGGDFVLAVNVSPSTLRTDSFKQLLPQRADRLVVEITENAAVECYDVMREGIQELETRGGRIAIDDVVAGYATLRHILRLEPRYIKLDIDLTRHIASDRRVRALAMGLSAFALELDAQIIAEGIESEAERQALYACNIPLGQGYHLGRPSAWPTDS